MNINNQIVKKCLGCSNPRLELYARCAKCLARHRKHTNKFEKKNRSNGLCSCGKDLITNSSCEKCWFSRMAKNRTGSRKNAKLIKSILERQNGLCAYTGEKLIIGVNASIDHIIPVSKNGSRDSPDNLQWVTLKINWFKSAYSHDEFIELCRLIASNRKLLATN